MYRINKEDNKMMLISDCTEEKEMEKNILMRREEDLQMQLQAVRMLIERDRAMERVEETPEKKQSFCEVITQDKGQLEESSKTEKLRVILKSIFQEVLEEYQEELCEDLKTSIKKEMDYQFRMQEDHLMELVKEEPVKEEEPERRDLLRRKYTLFS